MATGFMQRFKGKIKAAVIYLDTGSGKGIVDSATGAQLLGASGGLATVGTTADGLTAHAGGGQASALLLTASVNRLTTVATAADSVKLPPSAPNLAVVIINDGAHAAQVFGSGTDTIDGVATATGVPLTNAKRAIYYCLTAGAWQSLSGGVST
jgi:hypothetical protein